MTSLAIAEIRVDPNRREVDPAKVEDLAESIRMIGLLNPITVTRDKALVAGRHRLEAYRYLGRDFIPVQFNETSDPLLVELAEIDENLIRNDLTILQQSEHLTRREEILAELGRRASIGGQKGNDNAAKNECDNLTPSFFEPEEEPTAQATEPAKTTDEIAAEVGLSTRSTQRRLSIGKQLPKAIRDLIRGSAIEDNQKQLTALSKLKDDQQVAVAEKIASGEAVTVDVAKRLIQRERNAALVAENGESPTGLYRTIVIDPPWDYTDVGDNGMGSNFRGMPAYAQMSVQEIADLPIGDLAEDDAHLYLWTTNRLLPLSFPLMERWGFRYITMLTWCKPQIGLGNYFRNTTEHILFGVRGRLGLSNGKTPTHFLADRTTHSTKPDEFYRIVESCSPGAYVEFFARRPRPNWQTWGAEAH